MDMNMDKAFAASLQSEGNYGGQTAQMTFFKMLGTAGQMKNFDKDILVIHFLKA